MTTEPPLDRRFPKVPLERRISAFLIDFVTVWLLSSWVTKALQWFVFLILWMLLRVLVVEKNRGQTLGRWLLDMKVLDARFNKLPDLVALSKREGIIGVGAMLAMIGLSINLANGLSMLLLVSPLLIDCGAAFADEQWSQAIHDRAAETVIVPTRRGFSLDLRLKRLITQLQQNWRR